MQLLNKASEFFKKCSLMFNHDIKFVFDGRKWMISFNIPVRSSVISLRILYPLSVKQVLSESLS